MIKVKLTVNADLVEYPQIRQTPGRRGVWSDCRFFINQEVPECDWWVVYDDLPRPEQARCPQRNTLLIVGEPPSVKQVDSRFARQFATVVTCQEVRHPNVVHTQQCLPWFIGHRYLKDEGRWEHGKAKDYDDLTTLPPVPKTKRLSVISSDKAFTPGHRQRLEFVHHLKRHFGDALDVYGRGLRDFEDKWDAIAPYEYHVVLENSSYKDYWTEKLSDAILAEAFPFYSGCPNIADYFPEGALTPIDLGDFQAACALIEQGIREDRYVSSAAFRAQAKDLVLNTYNLFPFLSTLIQDRPPSADRAAITLQPEIRISSRPLEPRTSLPDKAGRVDGRNITHNSHVPTASSADAQLVLGCPADCSQDSLWSHLPRQGLRSAPAEGGLAPAGTGARIYSRRLP